MKIVFSIISVAFLSLASFTAAKREHCSDRARTCVMKWGGSYAACYETFRLAACEKTGKYNAPNGNVWPAFKPGAPGLRTNE